MEFPITCEVCGTVRLVKRYLRETAKYCSIKCANKVLQPRSVAARRGVKTGKRPHNWAGVFIDCRQCGKTFNTSPAFVKTKRYCSNACKHLADRAPPSIDPGGYVRIHVPGRGRMLEHRHIMEAHIGRRLLSSEQVDHINRIRDDNRLENLRILDPKTHGAISSACRGRPVSEGQPR